MRIQNLIILLTRLRALKTQMDGQLLGRHDCEGPGLGWESGGETFAGEELRLGERTSSSTDVD